MDPGYLAFRQAAAAFMRSAPWTPQPADSPTALEVAAWLEFIRHPTAVSWYRAHSMSVVGAHLEHRQLAPGESRVERFFLNPVLMRVLYAHALVAAPRLALGWPAFAVRPLGDPRPHMSRT